MKKYIVMSVFLLTACAGNPPAWWNPSGRYSASVSTPAGQQAPKTRTIPAQTVPEEETTFETDLDFEEMTLSISEESDEGQAALTVSQN